MGNLADAVRLGKDVIVYTKVPEKLLDGFQNGEYLLEGVTVRLARGPHRGRIVGHLELIDPLRARNNPLLKGQLAAKLLPQLSAAATFANLVFEVAQVQRTLVELEGRIKEIKDLLEERSLAELEASLSDLNRIKAFAPEQRITVAGQARFKLASLANQFWLRFKKSQQPQEAIHVLDLALAASLAHAYVYKLLDRNDLFIKELQDAVERWEEAASSLVSMLLGANPGRFFFKRYQALMPLTDFADALRLAYRENEADALSLLERVRPNPSGVLDHLPGAIKKALDKQLSQDKETVIPALRKLTAQKKAIKALLESTEVLREHVPLGELEAELSGLGDRAVEGLLWVAVDQKQQSPGANGA